MRRSASRGVSVRWVALDVFGSMSLSFMMFNPGGARPDLNVKFIGRRCFTVMGDVGGCRLTVLTVSGVAVLVVGGEGVEYMGVVSVTLCIQMCLYCRKNSVGFIKEH